MPQAKLILDYVYEHEAAQPERVYLTQPVGGGKVVDYRWREVLEQARRMAAHLQGRGLGRGDQIAILSKNCAHFFIAELAIWLAGGTTVAIFPSESAATLRYVLEHSEAKLLFVGKLDTWAQQVAGVPADLPRIAFPLAPTASGESWDEIVARHAPLAGRIARAADDIAMIAYTSGSTGEPKGVMHDFEGITRATEGIVRRMEENYRDPGTLRALSYLPLAHVFERAFVECATLVAGNTQVFFAESIETFLGDLKRARPTGFLSVPRLWLRFQQGVFAKMPPRKLDLLLRIPIVCRIVGRKVLAGLGLDHVQLAGSGSAPIPAELLAWYRKLGLNLIEGYAMSEDFAYSHTSTKEHNEPGWVGVAYPEVKVRISPEGEVLIQSPGRLVGYFKRPDLYAQSIDNGCLTPTMKLKRSRIEAGVAERLRDWYAAPGPVVWA